MPEFTFPGGACWCAYCDESFYRPAGTPIGRQIVCDVCIAEGNHNGEPEEEGT